MKKDQPKLYPCKIECSHLNETIMTLSTTPAYAEIAIKMVAPRWLSRNQKIVASDKKMSRFLDKIKHVTVETPSVSDLPSS
jgi:ribosomal protein L31